MDSLELKHLLKEPIVSQNQVVEFDFIFDTNSSGMVNIHYRDLGVRFQSQWDLDPDKETLTLTTPLNNDRTRVIKLHVLKFRSGLEKMESAYDVTGE